MKGLFAWFGEARRLFFVLTMVWTIFLVVMLWETYFNDHTYVVIVTGKERIVSVDEGETKKFYLFLGKDLLGNFHKFKVENILLRGKFFSSKIYNQIEVGETYEMTVVGLGFGFISVYETIVEARPIL